MEKNKEKAVNKYFLTDKITENIGLVQSRFMLQNGEKLSDSFFTLLLSQLQDNPLVFTEHLKLLEEPNELNEYQRYYKAFILDCERSAEEIYEAIITLSSDHIFFEFMKKEIEIENKIYILSEIMDVNRAENHNENEEFFGQKNSKNNHQNSNKKMFISSVFKSIIERFFRKKNGKLSGSFCQKNNDNFEYLELIFKYEELVAILEENSIDITSFLERNKGQNTTLLRELLSNKNRQDSDGSKTVFELLSKRKKDEYNGVFFQDNFDEIDRDLESKKEIISLINNVNNIVKNDKVLSYIERFFVDGFCYKKYVYSLDYGRIKLTKKDKIIHKENDFLDTQKYQKFLFEIDNVLLNCEHICSVEYSKNDVANEKILYFNFDVIMKYILMT